MATEKCGSKNADKTDNVDIWMGSLIVRSCLQRMSIIGMQNLVGMNVSNFKNSLLQQSSSDRFFGAYHCCLGQFHYVLRFNIRNSIVFNQCTTAHMNQSTSDKLN
jgi:hypothetical protein